MLPLDSITRAKMNLSISMNGLLLPVTAVPERLQRRCRPLAFFNEGSPYELSFSGSCLLARHHGRNLLLCSRHQLINAARRPDEIVIMLDVEDDRRVALNPNEVSQVLLDPTSDPDFANVADLLIAEYAAIRPGRDLAANFFPIDLAATPDLRAVPPESVDTIFAIGYPRTDTSYLPRHNEDDTVLLGIDIVSRWVKLELQRAEPDPWDHPGLIPLVPAREGEHLEEPDGMSGAPAFFIHGIKSGAPGLGFAGIIIRANKLGRANMVEAAHIRKALELHLDA